MPESLQKPAFDPAFLAKNVLAIFEQMDESIPNAIVLDPVQSELYDLLEGIEDDLYRIAVVEVVSENGSAVALTCAVALMTIFGAGSAMAEDVATVIEKPQNIIDFSTSAKNLMAYLGTNLAPILGLTLGVVAVIVVFRWMVKGASGKA